MFILENMTALKKLNSNDLFKKTCTKSNRAPINTSALNLIKIEGIKVFDSLNKILGPIKFSNISKFFKTEIYALGGVQHNNIKILNLLKLDGVGGVTLFD